MVSVHLLDYGGQDTGRNLLTHSTIGDHDRTLSPSERVLLVVDSYSTAKTGTH